MLLSARSHAQAHIKARAHMERTVHETFTLDVLGPQPPMLLPSAT